MGLEGETNTGDTDIFKELNCYGSKHQIERQIFIDSSKMQHDVNVMTKIIGFSLYFKVFWQIQGLDLISKIRLECEWTIAMYKILFMSAYVVVNFELPYVSESEHATARYGNVAFMTLLRMMFEEGSKAKNMDHR